MKNTEKKIHSKLHAKINSTLNLLDANLKKEEMPMVLSILLLISLILRSIPIAKGFIWVVDAGRG